MIEVVIAGSSFKNLSEFYDEVERKLTKGLDWKIGRNLDAFNDVLRGGFGVHEYEEPITLIWKHSEKNKIELNNEMSSKNYIPNGLFEEIVDIIRHHQHITLILQA